MNALDRASPSFCGCRGAVDAAATAAQACAAGLAETGEEALLASVACAEAALEERLPALDSSVARASERASEQGALSDDGGEAAHDGERPARAGEVCSAQAAAHAADGVSGSLSALKHVVVWCASSCVF